MCVGRVAVRCRSLGPEPVAAGLPAAGKRLAQRVEGDEATARTPAPSRAALSGAGDRRPTSVEIVDYH
jgi:hypothetical protein